MALEAQDKSRISPGVAAARRKQGDEILDAIGGRKHFTGGFGSVDEARNYAGRLLQQKTQESDRIHSVAIVKEAHSDRFAITNPINAADYRQIEVPIVASDTLEIVHSQRKGTELGLEDVRIAEAYKVPISSIGPKDQGVRYNPDTGKFAGVNYNLDFHPRWR